MFNNDGEKLVEPFDKTALSLLAEHENVEIMLQSIKSGSLVWIAPSDNHDLMEFFYILSGELTLESSDEEVSLKKNDYFYVSQLKSEVLLRSNTPLKILYITTSPLYNYLENFNLDLNELLVKIGEKDKYTTMHSRRVMDYSVKLCKKMKYTNATVDKIAIASLFHDVGKCFIPDEILNKAGKLDPEESRYIIKHPINSKRLLEPKFGKEIANIALMHHERIDGSGYPYGISGEEIPIEARIIAVADSFDAMTSKRVYSEPKGYEEAISELISLPNLYDKKVVAALKELFDSNKIFG